MMKVRTGGTLELFNHDPGTFGISRVSIMSRQQLACRDKKNNNK